MMRVTSLFIIRSANRFHSCRLSLSLSTLNSSVYAKGSVSHSSTRINVLSHSFRSLSTASDAVGLGGHKWSTMEPTRYQQIVRTALENGISTIEAGQDGGDKALAEAYRMAIQGNPDLLNQKVSLLLRVGYRTLVPPNVEGAFLPNDVHVEEMPFQGSASTTTGADHANAVQVVHNIGDDAIQQAIQQSPLFELQQEYNSVELVVMVHNPEVQAIVLTDATTDERQFRIRQRLEKAFQALENQVKQGHITSYGVVSNGLGLPPDHPLHVAWDTVLSAAVDTQEKVGAIHMSVVELPANLLEQRSLEVAKAVAQQQDIPPLQVYAMRPLSGSTDLGTGKSNPFILADYLLPATMEKKLQWSNTMSEPPEVYQISLKTAMAHFDAEEIIQAKLEGKKLTTEERETLDGCKLLQSLLHDVDAGLEKVRSFAAHEDELYQKIIPLIHDTFEGYDDETAHVLQSFFGAYSLAVRYAIARNTRKLLTEGETGSNIPKFDIPPEMRLQEFALRFLFQQGCIHKVILGISHPEQVIEDILVVDQILSENENKSPDDTKDNSS